MRENLTYNSNESQCLFTEADRNNISVLIGVSYKPPSANIESYSQSLSDILDKLDNCSKKCFLAGDFNIDLLKCESHIETNSFFNRLLTYSFFPTISKPTRITPDSATLIDNIYTNAYDIADGIFTGNLYTDISDHLPVFLVDCNAPRKKFFRKVTKRFFTTKAEENFKSDLVMVDWSNIYNSDDPNLQYNFFTTTISNLIDKHFPLTTVRINSNTTKN